MLGVILGNGHQMLGSCGGQGSLRKKIGHITGDPNRGERKQDHKSKKSMGKFFPDTLHGGPLASKASVSVQSE
jgi:hypothetical protein